MILKHSLTMEKNYAPHGPHVAQIRRFNPDGTDYWENVAGINEETKELIMAGPDDKMTLDEAADLCRRLNPTGFSAIYRTYRWEPPKQRA